MKKFMFFAVLAFVATAATAKRPDKRAIVQLETTAGVIKLALYDDTPIHRDNFLKLVANGFYDGLLFHRVIKDFMIQAGDPNSKDAAPGQRLGEGGLNYTLPAEIQTPYYYHQRGALAMARKGDEVNPERRSSSTQFYIVWGKSQSEREVGAARATVEQNTGGMATITPEMSMSYQTTGGTPHLDGQYTVFGEVIDGLKVVEAIQKQATDGNSRPLDDVRIIKATVLQYSAKKAKKR